MVPRTARIPDPSCARAQRRGAQTTEPGHHNVEFVNDVRVSPIDEGVGVVEKTNCHVRHEDPDCQRISSAVTPNNTKSVS